MTVGGGLSTLRSSRNTPPDVGASNPAIICSSVDLPHPEGPTMETKLPRATSRSTPSSATVVPPGAANALLMPRTRRNDGAAIDDGSGNRQYTARDIDRRLEQPVLLHQLHRARHPGDVHRRPELRQQHLVLERGIEVGIGEVDVARGGFVRIGELRALVHGTRELDRGLTVPPDPRCQRDD